MLINPDMTTGEKFQMQSRSHVTAQRRGGSSQMLRTLGTVLASVLFVAGFAHAQRPVVGVSVDLPVVSEEDVGVLGGWTFTVTGEIPPPMFDAEGNLVSGGLSVVADISGSLTIVDEIAGELDTTGLILGNFIDPAAGLIELTLLQNSAVLKSALLNDVIQEADQDYPLTLPSNDACVVDSNYDVDPTASTAAFTIIDGNGGPGIGPSVGLSVSQTELNEGDQVTVNFTVDGAIPPEGVTVLVGSMTLGALGEFAIFNEDGSPAFELTGISGFPEPGDATGNSFLVTIVEAAASMTLNVFNDGPNEGPDSLTFDVIDGEVYEVNPAANSGTVTINDGGTGEPVLPVVSFEMVPATVSEEDPLPTADFRFTVTGEMPPEGILANFDTLGENDIIAFTEQFATAPPAEFIAANLETFDPATGRIGWRLMAPEAIVRLFFLNDLIEEGPITFDFQLAEGEGYVVDPNQNATLFTLTEDNGGPGVGPTVGLTASATDLAEGDPVTATFTVTGDIPPEGVQVLVQSTVPGALGQFDLADLNNISTTGIAGLPVVGDGGGSSFIATIVEPVATISLTVFDDIIAEAPLEMPFTLANGEVYEVDPNAPGVTLNITDEPQAAGPTVGITLDRSDVIEGESVTLTITVTGDLPAEGLTVLINDTASAQNQARSLTEFDITGIQTTGLGAPPVGAEGDSGFFATLVAPTATITLPVLDDGVNEDKAQEMFTFELIDGEAYEVDPAAGSVMLNISDVGTCQPTMPTSGFMSDLEQRWLQVFGGTAQTTSTWPSRAELTGQ